MKIKTEKPTVEEIVAHIEAMANGAYYEKGGDIWAETWSTEDKENFVIDNKITTIKKAEKAAKKQFKEDVSIQAIQAENCALYDVEQEQYDALQEAAGVSTKTKSVIDPKIKKAYGKSQSCNDDIAKKLKVHFSNAEDDNDRNRLFAMMCDENGIDGTRWGHLNFGMQRMNLGNVLRGMAKRGEQVNIVV